MATSSKESQKVLEGIFAINKPQWASSAGVLRDLQTHFAESSLFAPWLTHTRRNLILSHAKQKHIKNLNVKLGHGGTLDPLATGVLIVGAGRGTKCLQRFLECTKTYECVVLFGAATDSYDAVGKVVSRADYTHVTKELVESKLADFRGKIMQKPSVFSALRVDGKRMYEYARAGSDIPEVPARPVEVQELELLEWLEPGTHDYTWPKEELDSTEKEGAEKLLGIRKEDADAAGRRGKKRSRSPEATTISSGLEPKKSKTDDPNESEPSPGEKPLTLEAEIDNLVTNPDLNQGEPKSQDEPAMSGALPVQTEPSPTEIEPTLPADTLPDAPKEPSSDPLPQPPAARLRMTVTSGFYVRSLCHDLGLACSSLGLMSLLIRSRQGDYTLNQNVLEYTDLEAGPAVWEPKLQAYLEEFMQKEGWEPELVEDEETWDAKRKEREGERKEGDRDRSYQGGSGRKKWRGKSGGGGGGGGKRW